MTNSASTKHVTASLPDVEAAVLQAEGMITTIDYALGQLMAIKHDDIEYAYTILVKIRNVTTATAANTSTELITDATKVRRNIYDVTPYTKLRRFLDADNPIDVRADECTERFKAKRLMHYYHPDRKTGNLAMFQLVKNMQDLETVNVLHDAIMGIQPENDDAHLKLVPAIMHRQSFKIARLYISNKENPKRAIELLRHALDTTVNRCFWLKGLHENTPESN